MTIEYRSVFSRKYEEKIKGSLLCSHPFPVHPGQAVRGRESIQVFKCQCWDWPLASPWCVWGSDLYCPTHEQSSASREMCCPQKSQSYPRVCKSGMAMSSDQLHAQFRWIRISRQVYHRISAILRSSSLPSVHLTSVVQCMQGRGASVQYTAIWMQET